MKKICILIFLTLLISCSDENKTDRELLLRDQKELNKNLTSYKVSTYKFGKILIRSSVSKDSISPEFNAFKSDLDRIFKKVVKYNLDSTESLSLLDYVSIYRDYNKMEDFITRTDEDIFPTLSDAFHEIYADSTSKKQEFYTGKEKEYVQNIEHSILSAIVILSKDLGKEVSLYECSKTKPALLPDGEIKTLLQFFRGFLFFEKGLYYLSEDEISRNITWLNSNNNIELPYTRTLFKWGNLDNAKTHVAFHGMNHLFRGFDRLMMDRKIDEERALKDFELFLEDTKAIGLDNELIWSIETYLYLKNDDQEKSIASLKKLQSSHLLSSSDKKRVTEAIVYVENRESGKVLNGIYDKFFLSKIATKYIYSILAKTDWEQIMKEQNVPHTEEMFKTIDNFNELMVNLNTYSSTEKLKEVGKDLKDKSKNLWNKAIEMVD